MKLKQDECQTEGEKLLLNSIIFKSKIQLQKKLKFIVRGIDLTVLFMILVFTVSFVLDCEAVDNKSLKDSDREYVNVNASDGEFDAALYLLSKSNEEEQKKEELEERDFDKELEVKKKEIEKYNLQLLKVKKKEEKILRKIALEEDKRLLSVKKREARLIKKELKQLEKDRKNDVFVEENIPQEEKLQEEIHEEKAVMEEVNEEKTEVKENDRDLERAMEIAKYEAELAEERRKKAAALAKRNSEKKKESSIAETKKSLETIEVKKKPVSGEPGEISDMELANRKKLAEDRMLKPVLKSLTVKFMSASYSITGYWKGEIKDLVEEIKGMDYKKIFVEAYTDSLEKEPKKLSRLRAKEIYNELLKNGIPAEKIDYIGLAASIFVDSNETEAGRMNNRRAKIIVE